MKLMDLSKPYSGRLRVAEANAEVLLEIDDIKHELAGVKWTSRKMILYPGVRLRTEQLPLDQLPVLPVLPAQPEPTLEPEDNEKDLIPPRTRTGHEPGRR